MTRMHLHLISDSTGETLEALVKAALAQFDDVDAVKHYWPMVRSEGHLDRVMDEIAKVPGLILFTLVGDGLRARLDRRAAALGLPVIAVMDPVMGALERVLGAPTARRPGGQHRMDEAYFGRMDAINWTMDHDDGLLPEEWDEADIVLVGVSRSSKTPTSVYLANRGYRVANQPWVPDRPLPRQLFDLKRPLIVGLTVAPDRLVQVRRARLLGEHPAGHAAKRWQGDYVNRERIEAEVAAARRLFADRGWPVIDVTRRSIEETAAEIVKLKTIGGGGV